MLHLPAERLAALCDEPPTPEEEAHLAVCDACDGERSAYDMLVVLAGQERNAFGLPLTRWDAIAAALPAPIAVGTPRAPYLSQRRALQIAAGFLLVASGAMLGRVSAGARPLPDGTVRQAGRAPITPSASLASNNPDSAFFDSADEARAAQLRSEAVYQQATAFLARFDTAGGSSGTPVAYRSRLAALDRMISTTRAAMRDVPHDPVMNGYYLNTLGQREATLRQLNTALPASLHVNSF